MDSPYNNSLVQWLQRSGFWMRPGDMRSPTRNLMYPRGRASVPEDKYDAFLMQYATYVLMTEDPQISVVEVHGNTFTLFMGCDFKLAKPDTILEHQQRLLSTIYSSVRPVVPEATEMVVCQVEPFKLKDSDTLYKVGTLNLFEFLKVHGVGLCDWEVPGTGLIRSQALLYGSGTCCNIPCPAVHNNFEETTTSIKWILKRQP